MSYKNSVGPDHSTHPLTTHCIDTPLYSDTRYNDEIRYNDNLTVMKPSFKR